MPVTFDIARNRMSASIYRFGAFILNASARELVRDGERIALPPRAFACLLMLVESRERALGREELIGALWRRGVASDVQLGQLIVQCRRALDDDGQKQWAIRTVPGFGYQWVAAIDGSDAVAVAGTAADVGNDREGESASAVPSAPVEVVPPSRPAGTSAVEAAAAPLPLPRRGRPRRVALACAIAVAAVAVAAFSWRRAQRPTPAPAAARMLVLPLAVEGDDQAWLRLGGMDLVADRLRRGGFMVQPSEQTVGQLRALGADSGDATQALRRANTSATLVDGRVEHRDGRWFARVSAGRADAPPASANADATTPIAALGAAADRLVAALGHVPPTAGDGVSETLQRAQAALLANQPDAARSILLSDERLARDTPRLRLQLAEVNIRAGRLDAAREALDALLAEPGGDAAFRAQLLAARGTIAVRSGQYAEAGRWFGDGIAALGGQDDPQLLGRLHNGRAISRTSLEDYPAALLDYGIAREAFGRAGDEGSVARVDGNIGALELLRAHPAQAEPYLTAAIARFETLGMVQERLGELQLLFESRRAQLDNPGAWAAMDASWAQHGRVPSRYSQLSMRLYRTEELLQQGRHNEAALLLDDPANDGHPADAAENERIRLLRAELAWRRGDGAAALAELEPVPAQSLPSADSDLIRADIELLRARIARSLGRTSADDGAPAADAAPNARTPIRLAAAANRAWTAGRNAEAARAFADAYAVAQAQSVPLSILRVAVDYADFLLAQGRAADAAVIAGQVAPWARQDYDAALVQLAVAHAQGRREAWQAAVEQASRLAGERAIPRALLVPPT